MRGFHLFCGNAEPSIEELLNDSAAAVLMDRDGITADEVRDLMETMRWRRRDRHARESGWLEHWPVLEPARN